MRIVNEYHYSAVGSKKLQDHLTTEKIKPTTVSRRLRTGVTDTSAIKRAAEEQCLQPSFEGDAYADPALHMLRGAEPPISG